MTPDTYTIKEQMLDVGQGHRLYVHLWGSPDAPETIVHLHGGPGSGCSDRSKTGYDPMRQRVVFFDQRGCGKSTPYGSLEANDTDHLVEDITAVAAACDAGTFVLTGGSWGSCLALTYAVRHPEKVTRMVLRGIFTGRQKEIDFLDRGGFRAFFPDIWQKFAASVPAEYAAHPGGYHLPRILGDDPAAAKESAYAYSKLESGVISLDDRMNPEAFDDYDPTGTIIECHYLANRCFLPEGYVISNAAKLTMPIILIQGRYDAVCPPFTAYELSQILPDCKLYWTIAGHSGSDRANWELTRALLAA